MTTTKKTKVSSAISATIQSFHAEIMAAVIRIESEVVKLESDRKEVMTKIVAAYGEQAVMPASKGGISGNAMRTEDSAKAEASRLNIAPGAAKELHGIIKAINGVRANVWQDYQRAYFGRTEKVSTPKDVPENIKTLKAEKAEHEKEAQICKAHAALAKAAMLTAESDAAYEEAKGRMDEANKNAKGWTALAKASAEKIKVAAEDNAGADAYGTLCEALKKLGEKYQAHKDKEVTELAKQVLALL